MLPPLPPVLPPAAALAGLLLALSPGVPGPLREPTASVRREDPNAIAARGAGQEITVQQLDHLLLDRFAMAQKGSDVLELLVRSRLLESLASEAGLRVTDREVAALWSKLDAQLRASGQERGLSAEVKRRGIGEEEFRRLLRLSIVQERLTKKALGIGKDDEVTESQQEVWLTQELNTRGLERPGPPWSEGFAARTGDVVVSTFEFGEMLRKRLDPKDIQEACWHLLLERAALARMPDLAPAALEEAVEAEIARRRIEHKRTYPGLTFEQRLAAVGRNLDSLHRDPAVRVAAISHIWVDRTYGEEGLRKTFEEERSYFEGRFGRAGRVSALFLLAGRFKNELVPRTFEQATSELARMAERAGDLADFAALVDRFSEEPETKKNHGALGWVTREDPKVAAPIRAALFDFLDAGGSVPAEGVPVGPLRVDSGAVLLWLSAVRPTPEWDTMRGFVHSELRRRFVVDVMPTGAMEILIGKEKGSR